MLKFGVIGTGVGGEFVVRAMKELEKEGLLKVVAVVGRKPTKTEEFAKKWGVKSWYTCSRDMITREELDAVAISVPHYLHYYYAIEAIDAGLHVLVDKPIAVNLVEADEMINRAERKGVKLGVILQNRFDPKFRKIKDLIETGKLGKIILGEALVEWYRTHDYYAKSDWRGRWGTEGGGALINQAIHMIDILLWFMGDPSEVYAIAGTYAHEIEVEDLAVAVLKYSSQAIGVIEASTAIYPGLPTRVEIHGTKGTVIWEAGKIKMLAIEGEEVYSEKEEVEGLASWARPEAVPPYNHIELIRDFVKAVEEDRRPFVDGREGRRSLELIRAIYLSQMSKSPVKYPIKEHI